ncbi:MAG: PilZ domain-containing protein [Syntrophomonas sp.]
MKANDLRENQLIEIEVDTDSNEQLLLPSRIEEVVDNYLHVSVPMYRGTILPLRVGETIKIYINFNDNTYVFYALVVGRKWNKIPLLIIEKPDQFIKIQRRGFLRLPVAVPIKYRPAGENTELYDGVTVDISGGGALLSTQCSIEEGQILEMEIDLPDREPVFCRARVIRLLERRTREGQINKAALQFSEIIEGKRDKIINFIFEKQREWIKKGLRQ